MSRPRSIALALTFAAASATIAPTAGAQLATFDDVAGCTPTNGGGIAINNGYQGFNWSNFYVVDGPAATAQTGGVGYTNGIATAPCVALNGFGAASELSAASAFTFNGGYFTAAFTDGLSVSIVGYNGATSLFSTVLTLNTAGPQLLNVAWDGVDRVTFASGNGQPGSQFVFDNFRFNNTFDPTIAPEPASIVLLGGGLLAFAGVGAVRRRRTS